MGELRSSFPKRSSGLNAHPIQKCYNNFEQIFERKEARMNNDIVAVKLTPKKSNKRLALIIVFAVLAYIFVLGFGAWILSANFGSYHGEMYESEEEVYNYFDEAPHEAVCYDFDYSKKLESIKSEYVEGDDVTAERVKTAAALPQSMDTVVDEANLMIIDYFERYYSVSVKAELAELRAVYCELNDLGIAGVYYFEDEGVTDGNVIAIDSGFVAEHSTLSDDDVLGRLSWKQHFFEVYIHEALHYIGSACEMTDGIDWMYFVEGITEALTEDIIRSGGYSYENTSTYILNKKLAEQLILADKEIVVLMIEGFDYITDEELNEYFDSRSFEGMGEAIEDSVTLVMGHPYVKKYQRMAQHLMGEYLKYYELTDEQQIRIAEHFIAPISMLEK